MNKRPYIIDVHNIKKIYRNSREYKYTALKEVSFKVVPGEFIGIVGASGSGKTTLLNILSTLDTPSGGQVMIDGQSLSELKGNDLADFRAQKIGFIFQDFNLLENLTVFENIALPLFLQNTMSEQITSLVFDIAKNLSITHLLNGYITKLSGGQKQLVAIGRALITKPSILFCDEPTGALDSKSSQKILNILKKVNQEQRTTILLVTHDPIAASYCHRVLFINDGKINQKISQNTKS